MAKRKRAAQAFTRDELLEKAYLVMVDTIKHFDSGHLVCSFSAMCDTDCTALKKAREFATEFKARIPKAIIKELEDENTEVQ